jgi:1-pyrroline-4-hydroxy-2-carboxylate deaminase
MSPTCDFTGVFAAITTPFTAEGHVDLPFLARHATQLVAAGCAGIIPLGSLGEAATLDAEEREAILAALVEAVGAAVPVAPGIASASTADAVRQARAAERGGASGLMVLPPYVYRGDAREMSAHVSAAIAATPLPCMLYNNPVAYGTDFLPAHIAALAARHPNLVAVKESSTDVRRVTEIRARLGDRLAIAVGVDDLVLEAVAAGAVGWVAGLVNAFPRESVALFRMCASGRAADAAPLYRWFLPLLRMDTSPQLVQLIKLAQERTGTGSSRVRPPRLPLMGAELEAAQATITAALAARPEV